MLWEAANSLMIAPRTALGLGAAPRNFTFLLRQKFATWARLAPQLLRSKLLNSCLEQRYASRTIAEFAAAARGPMRSYRQQALFAVSAS